MAISYAGLFLGYPLLLTFTSLLLDSSDHGAKVTEVRCEHISPITRHLQQLTHTVPLSNTHREYLHSASAQSLGRTLYIIL